jgi:hypothetical protein
VLSSGCTLPVAVAAAGVPTTAQAVVLDLTTVGTTTPGYLTVYPCGITRPLAAALVAQTGLTMTVHLTVPVGGDGQVCVYTTATTSLVVDVVGYESGTGGARTHILPGGGVRVEDTRTGPVTPLPAGSTQRVNTAYGTAIALAENITSTNSKAVGFVSVGCPRGVQADLTVLPGRVVGNRTMDATGGGQVCTYNSSVTDLVVDIQAWLDAGPGGDLLHAMVPSRVVDTRTGLGMTGAGPVGAGATVNLSIPGSGGIPATGVDGLLLTVSVVSPSGPGYMTLYPCDQPRPGTSNINFPVGVTVTNTALVRVPPTGKVCLYTAGSTDVVVDAAGWYSTAP